MNKFNKKSAAVIEKLAARVRGVRGGAGGAEGAGELLSLLHAVAEKFGYIPEEYIPAIAGELNLSQAEVYGFITFYKDFRLTPPAKHTIRVCQAESCLAMGGAELAGYVKTRLGIKPGRKAPGKRFSLETVYCFGNCACSPSVMVDGKLYGKVDLEKLKNILDRIKD